MPESWAWAVVMWPTQEVLAMERIAGADAGEE